MLFCIPCYNKGFRMFSSKWLKFAMWQPSILPSNASPVPPPTPRPLITKFLTYSHPYPYIAPYTSPIQSPGLFPKPKNVEKRRFGC